ncbi:hypothetical protein M432DRAFT_401450 [Thermoascus aurantiacus ATCC 26904]
MPVDLAGSADPVRHAHGYEVTTGVLRATLDYSGDGIATARHHLQISLWDASTFSSVPESGRLRFCIQIDVSSSANLSLGPYSSGTHHGTAETQHRLRGGFTMSPSAPHAKRGDRRPPELPRGVISAPSRLCGCIYRLPGRRPFRETTLCGYTGSLPGNGNTPGEKYLIILQFSLDSLPCPITWPTPPGQGASDTRTDNTC